MKRSKKKNQERKKWRQILKCKVGCSKIFFNGVSWQEHKWERAFRTQIGVKNNLKRQLQEILKFTEGRRRIWKYIHKHTHTYIYLYIFVSVPANSTDRDAYVLCWQTFSKFMSWLLTDVITSCLKALEVLVTVTRSSNLILIFLS